MRPKERILAALHHQQPDDLVPAWEIEFQLYQELLGEDLVVGEAFGRLSAQERDRATHRNVELMIMVAERTHQCALCSTGGYWEVAPGHPARYWLPDREAMLAELRAINELAGDAYLVLGRAGGTIGIPDGDHMAAFCYRLFDDREAVRQETYLGMERSIAWGQQQLEAGADGVVMCTDVAFNSGPFLKPDLIAEIMAPPVYLWAETFRALGAPTIWHTDGDVTPLLPMMVDAGVTALQAIDPIAGMDIVALKAQYAGQIALIGNVNCLTLQFGPPEAIEAECRRILEGCKAGGGYVFGSSNAVFKGIPIEHYCVAIEALERYGSYG
jgi:uroporphyrinogen decarboxylase